MPEYRRARAAGGTFFFTVVTYRRQPLLTAAPVRMALREAIIEVRRQWPFDVEAWVLLPDHLHCVWRLPADDGNYSARWAAIKRFVTQRVPHPGLSGTRSRLARQEGSLWQRRFWEHQIRDEDDLRRHVDYIYWNPVKHGLVRRVTDWPYSTFHRDIRLGRYPADWGGADVDGEMAGLGEPA